MPHIHEKVDFTVAAYIVNGDKVLLIKHLTLKKWLPLGGHIELDEDPEAALFREIEEESGIKRVQLEVIGNKPELESDGTKFLFSPTYLDIHRINSEHRHIGMTYFLRSSTNRLVLAEKEHSEIRWFPKNDMEKTEFNLSPAVKFYSRQALSIFANFP